MADRTTSLISIIETVLKGEPVVMYDFLRSSTTGASYSLFLEKEGGVSMADCVRYARLISFNPDVQELFPEGLRIEVSSPGIHRALRLPWHFQKAQGKNIKLSLHTALEGRKQFEGILERAGEENITLAPPQGDPLTFTYKDIKSAKTNEEIKIGAKP